MRTILLLIVATVAGGALLIFLLDWLVWNL